MTKQNGRLSMVDFIVTHCDGKVYIAAAWNNRQSEPDGIACFRGELELAGLVPRPQKEHRRRLLPRSLRTKKIIAICWQPQDMTVPETLALANACLESSLKSMRTTAPPKRNHPDNGLGRTDRRATFVAKC